MIFCVENGYAPDFESRAGVDLEQLCGDIGDRVLEMEGVDPVYFDEIEASLYIVDSDAIREMNRDHRGIDSATDVLSFPNLLSDGELSASELIAEGGVDVTDPETGNILAGDIVINNERVFSQAEEFGHSPKREFAFLLTHSLLHLMGYDHETPEEAAVMEEKQERILNDLGITRE